MRVGTLAAAMLLVATAVAFFRKEPTPEASPSRLPAKGVVTIRPTPKPEPANAQP